MPSEQAPAPPGGPSYFGSAARSPAAGSTATGSWVGRSWAAAARREAPGPDPWWARPALAAVTALAGLAYAWRLGRDPLEPYYAAAVRSMAMSWHNFLFGAFDPAGTVTLDKLPGAFWLQALSVRAFGVHVWALILPQVVEGVLAVLVLYRAVRRLAGPGAGLIAAAILAASPSTTALNRGNISDSLMILLLVLAADGISEAVVTGHGAGVYLAAVWAGLAFQAKMLQAWLVVPALALAFLVAAPSGTWVRIRRLAISAVVLAAVSLAWMTFVALTPAHSRPYVDGSQHNSVFSQVFVYNGFGRLGEQSPLSELKGSGLSFGLPAPPATGATRLLKGPIGRDTGWLLPAAAVSAVALLAARRRRGRTDPVRAGVILWGGWLVTLFLAFSVGSSLNPYYTAALSPPVAALLGMAATEAWSRRGEWTATAIAAATVLLTVLYAAWLIPAHGTGRPGWLTPVMFALGLVALGALLAPFAQTARFALPVAGVAVLLAPVVAAASVVQHGLGAFDTPFESTATAASIQNLFVAVPRGVIPLLPTLERDRRGSPILVTTQSAVIASPFIFYSGKEALPIGGFTGTIPEPTVADLRARVAAGEVHLVIASSTADPRLAWVDAHCLHVRSPDPALLTYYCLPANASS